MSYLFQIISTLIPYPPYLLLNMKSLFDEFFLEEFDGMVDLPDFYKNLKDYADSPLFESVSIEKRRYLLPVTH